MDTHRPELALPRLQRALAVDGSDPHTLLEMGQWHLKFGEKPEGYAYLRSAVEADVAFEDPYYVIASELQLEGDYRRSLEAAKVAIDLFPRSSRFYRLAGIAYGKLKAYQKEVEYLQKAVDLAPHDSRALIALGNFYWRNQERDTAATYYERARAISPAELDVRVLLAGYYFEEGRLSEMKACIDEAVLLAPESSVITELFANYSLEMGNRAFRSSEFGKAEGFYLDSLENAPEAMEANVNLTMLQLKTRQLDKARARLEGLIEHNKELDFAYPLLAAVALEAGKVDYARELIRVGMGLVDFRSEARSKVLFDTVNRQLTAID
ncbi:tetratricopeptide repeat protein [Pelagicoccus sp. SDUM812005]|uniref:tetratricopeptide repeat protein n=1 Tax=Pelagicoccus sp. SDUM812005 TaxID=3041257 RepID=UPI00280C454A|nr:tetratricopeptide repeat protein [Pelagicoccus sp. SDUM812005]MDQ8180339.1 tetratricopeptide repeat protein [Pelagicoccus sp. SDUM812005]